MQKATVTVVAAMATAMAGVALLAAKATAMAGATTPTTVIMATMAEAVTVMVLTT